MSKQLTLFDSAENLVTENNKYSKKIMTPQYIPSEVCPNIAELCQLSKYSELVTDIVSSNVSEEEKEFLIKAATRHLVFNYSKIADYYAHATPEMQRLMEKSALVVIDYNDAIANGYVKLSETIKKIVEGDNNDTE